MVIAMTGIDWTLSLKLPQADARYYDPAIGRFVSACSEPRLSNH
jgi:hypothetical protein